MLARRCWITLSLIIICIARLPAQESGEPATIAALRPNISPGGIAAAATPIVSYRDSHPFIEDRRDEDQRIRRDRKRWGISVLVLIAANVLDAHSSWGKIERNHALRNSGGMFGARSVGIKAGMVGGALAVQSLSSRKNPRLLRPFTYMNHSIAAAFSITAARNYSLPKAATPPSTAP